MNSSSTQNITSNLAEALVRIARERGIIVEHLRAVQVLAETQLAWPGTVETMWSKWLAESAKSVELQASYTRLSVSAALDLVEDGVQLVCYRPDVKLALIVVGYDGRKVEIVFPATDKQQKITTKELTRLIDPSIDEEEDFLQSEYNWLVIEDLELSHEPCHTFHDRPVARLIALLKPERSDIWVVAVFAFFAGLLSLATPIAVESLVNIVAFGRLLQPLLILSVMLFGFLTFASMMRALQTFVVEIIQRRLFVRVAADLAYRFPRVTHEGLSGKYGPELANRFFDIVTLQKVVAQLLLDGIAIVLATAVGMAVLAFYHPWLLGFDVLLLALVVGGVLLLGRGAINSGIDESKQKYRLAAWLEDLMRCRIGFKVAGGADFALDRANQITADYLASRRKHFHVLFRQLLFILGLQAVAGTVLLGFGGWLVMQGQLTLGQLVAAELIVATILGSLAKLGKHIEGFYDVVASVDKIGHLIDLEIEPQDGMLTLRPGAGMELRISDVKHASSEHWGEQGLTLSIESGESVVLHSHSEAGSTILFDFLYGLRVPESGHIEIENADPRDLRPDILRESVSLVRGIEVFEGTIAENIQLARPGVSMTDVRTALSKVGLLDDVLRLPEGLDTKLNAAGQPLRPTQLNLLMLARGIAAHPRLLLIDGTLDLLGDVQLLKVCELLCDESTNWTLLVATNRYQVTEQFARVIDQESQQEIPQAMMTSPELIS